MSNSQDRRRAPRIEILDRIHGHIAALNTAITVREMSMVGMSIETSFAFPIGAIHEFRLTLGDDSTTLLRGEVTRCDEARAPGGETTYVAGVRFIDEEPADGESVGDLINKIK